VTETSPTFVALLLDAPDWFEAAEDLLGHPDLVTADTARLLAEEVERAWQERDIDVADRAAGLAVLVTSCVDLGVEAGFIAFLRRREKFVSLWNDLLGRAVHLDELDAIVVANPELLDRDAMSVAHELLQTWPGDVRELGRRLALYAGFFNLARARKGRIL
jgi:hypothetical protein